MKCPYCHRDFLKSDGCTYKHVRIGGKVFERIKVGGKGDWCEGMDEETRCGDCGAKVGHYHHPECDSEVSPLDGGQLLFRCDEYLK